MAKTTAAIGKHSDDNHFDALVIGAGFSGLYSLICLRDKLGLSVKVLEAGPDVGGVWYWNRYPGARCDSESHVYGFTFSDELLREWEWNERYPNQSEILQYFAFVDRKFDLRRSIQFNTPVTSASYDEQREVWILQTSEGETFTARFVVSAVGCLSSVNVPNFPGLESFAGKWYHTGNWPHEEPDFTGKNVGLIGTGSSGVQAAPVIAEAAKQLTVFQRSPSLSVPAHNAPLRPERKQWVKENATKIVAQVQTTVAGHDFDHSPRTALETSPEQRRALYEAAWKVGGVRLRSTFSDLLISKAANDTVVEFIKDKIGEIVKDPATAHALTNVDHPYATKRPTFDTGYYEIFNRSNVRLVDVRKSPIKEITPSGLRTSDAEYPLDVLVFATGYDAITGPLLRLNITGVDGRRLADDWKSGPSSYLGLQIPGFPNLFTVTGPGSPSVLTNVPVAIQQHVEWIAECIAYMRTHDFKRIEAKRNAMEWWQGEVANAANATLLPLAASWYQGSNVDGKPRVFMPYAGGMVRYRQVCRDVAAKGYSGFDLR